MADLDSISVELRAMRVLLEQLVGLVVGRPGRAIATGTVRPPEDLGPAIAALAPAARERMIERLNGAQPTPADVVEAADWWTAEEERAA